MKKYINAPLPFRGQKRRFVREIEEMAQQQGDGAVFVDLFGGSGLVSHTIKRARPDARVVYNDFDHYTERLANIGHTNALLEALRPILRDVPYKARITGKAREELLAEVKRWDVDGFVDYVTLSSNILFTMNYVGSYDELSKDSLYNRIRQDGYDASGYLEGVEVVSMDYRKLFEQFKDVPGVVFVLDPPYLSTDCGTYNSGEYWRLSDYLDVLTCLVDTKYVYFSSSRSTIVELAEWIGRHQSIGNPFEGAKVYQKHVGGKVLNYEDMMLVKAA